MERGCFHCYLLQCSSLIMLANRCRKEESSYVNSVFGIMENVEALPFEPKNHLVSKREKEREKPEQNQKQ